MIVTTMATIKTITVEMVEIMVEIVEVTAAGLLVTIITVHFSCTFSHAKVVVFVEKKFPRNKKTLYAILILYINMVIDLTQSHIVHVYLNTF